LRDHSRVKRIPVTMDLLLNVFTTGQKIRAEIVQGIPLDSVIVRHAYDHATGFYWITIQNESFEPVKMGDEIPVLPIVCKTLPPDQPNVQPEAEPAPAESEAA
jgi:hypothetical protein